ncbi:hypothetical protein P0D75_02400 [Paraburkholderia sediminicola]|uniref:hypothetical protein n=1 Tax=Paraburkholderia sediminicola TaxID=458836 RepID=UPI0038B8709F
MTLEDGLGIVGIAIGVVSLAYAVFANRELARVRKFQAEKLRSNIKECIILMVESFRLIKNKTEFELAHPDVLLKLGAIHTTSTGLLRTLFQELSQVDKPYDLEKLNFYVSTGVITSQWVWEQAATFLDVPGGISPPPNLPEKTRDWFLGSFETGSAAEADKAIVDDQGASPVRQNRGS